LAIAFTVNGSAKSVDVPETTSLLEVLRNHLGLMGTRYGCGLEQCGACMVLVDGQPVFACTRETGTIAGRSVATIEGLGTPDRLHPLQQAFLDEQAGAVRLLPLGHPHVGQGAARQQPQAFARRDRGGARPSISAGAAPISASSAPSSASRGRHERAHLPGQPGRQSAARPLDPFQ
jgi:hypothetical protein